MFADQQPCQNGLVLEDHSGGYRIEPIRPDGVLVSNSCSLSEHLNPLSVWEKTPGCLCNGHVPNSLDRQIAIP
jgi:hypothetical protein